MRKPLIPKQSADMQTQFNLKEETIMAIKIAVANQKGGVGKSTTAINIADVLRLDGNKVLFLDLDPQRNSTTTYGAKIDGENTIVDVLKKDCTAAEAIQHLPLGDIIAGDPLLAQEKTYFDSKFAKELLLKKALKDVEGDYDYVVMDTPPDLGVYMVNALAAADGCVIPMKADKYSADGLAGFIGTINDITDALNDKLRIYGVLLCMYDVRNKLDRDIKEILPAIGKESGFHVFSSPVRISQDIKNVQAFPDEINENGDVEVTNRSLIENFPNSNGALDYIKLVDEMKGEIVK